MKACAQNLKRLSWLAIDALEPQQAEALRAHVAVCPGCARYLEEISGVAGKLSATGGGAVEMEASDAFHRKLVRRIAAEGQPGVWTTVRSWLRVGGTDWRVAAPVAGIALGVAALLLVFGPWTKQ